jgi:NitT/TauT family transport system substrate-binding protein
MKIHLPYSILALALGALWLAGCSTAPVPEPPLPTAPAPTVAPNPASGLTEVRVVMGYIPNVQFAPFYVAESKGYFAEAGLKVKFNWGFEVDGIKLVGANQSEFAMLGGDQVIQARAQEIPLVYIANYYNGFPIVVVSFKDKQIEKPQDLAGKKVGLPAFFGATYTGWRALLYEGGVKESDVKVQDIGFAQVAVLTQGIVDAVAGYANNEPVQLRLQGKEINVIRVADYSRLVGIGLVTNEKTIAEKPQVVSRLAAALLRGVQYSMDAESGFVLAAALLVGTPILSLLGAIGAALTLGLRAGSSLLALLILPLYVPVLIFGAGSVDAVRAGLGAAANLSLLGAGLLVAVVGAPFAAAAAVRIALD